MTLSDLAKMADELGLYYIDSGLYLLPDCNIIFGLVKSHEGKRGYIQVAGITSEILNNGIVEFFSIYDENSKDGRGKVNNIVANRYNSITDASSLVMTKDSKADFRIYHVHGLKEFVGIVRAYNNIVLTKPKA